MGENLFVKILALKIELTAGATVLKVGCLFELIFDAHIAESNTSKFYFILFFY